MNKLKWVTDAVFYHIYPLGCFGAPETNNFSAPASPRLEQLLAWVPYLRNLGVNALYLGPVFQSSRHGYDTADFFQVDYRLGTNRLLAEVTATLAENGIKVVLDAVFHHVGRDFWAFRDVLVNGTKSSYQDWFHLDFTKQSPFGDPFAYQSWNGNFDLVKLNVHNPKVKRHLLEAVAFWIDNFWINGLRLDVADALDRVFQQELAAFCKLRRPDFWLMGEVVHGDYRRWACPGVLDSVTNYELYKGLWSSHNDANYFEVAYSLNREFGQGGIYRDLLLYNFADNHDVERVATMLHQPAHLYPLYALLLTCPGIPSIYYASEWGMEGCKTQDSDVSLRPTVQPEELSKASAHSPLYSAICRFIKLRHQFPALRLGGYRQLLVQHQQFAFERSLPNQRIVVVVNAAPEETESRIPVGAGEGAIFCDHLDNGREFKVQAGYLQLPLNPNWARVLVLKG
jgi:glycosidase